MNKPLELPEIADELVSLAQRNEEIEVCLSRSRSTTVKAYSGEVESVRSGMSEGVGIRVIVNGQQGFATAGSLNRQVLTHVLEEARGNLQFAESDPDQGLAEPDGVKSPNLDLVDPEVLKMSDHQKSSIAIELEQRCLSADRRVSSVRSAAWSDGWGEFALASTNGISVYAEGGS